MNKRFIYFGMLLLSLAFSAFAHTEETFWQKYDWYLIGAGIVLLLYVLFKIMKKLIILGLIIAAVVIAGNILLQQGSEGIGVVGEIHYHADFAVYLNGERYNFSQEKYMSTENKSLSNFAHFHDMDGNIIHKHAEGVTLGFFLDTLDISLNDSCLILDDDTPYCNDGEKILKMYVNGKENDDFSDYDIHEEDKILISYGDESEEEIQSQLDSLTEDACIYSLTCPEKGTPPEEATCVGETCTVEG